MTSPNAGATAQILPVRKKGMIIQPLPFYIILVSFADAPEGAAPAALLAVILRTKNAEKFLKIAVEVLSLRTEKEPSRALVRMDVKKLGKAPNMSRALKTLPVIQTRVTIVLQTKPNYL